MKPRPYLPGIDRHLFHQPRAYKPGRRAVVLLAACIVIVILIGRAF